MRRDSEYYCFDRWPGFHFDLLPSEHIIAFPGDVAGEIFLTCGESEKYNTVRGNAAIKETGRSFWEVEVAKLGSFRRYFTIGIAENTIRPDRTLLVDEHSTGFAAGIRLHNADYPKPRGGHWARRHTGEIWTEIDARLFPQPKQGSRLGLLVDRDTGMLAYFLDGKFRAIHHGANATGKQLYPAFSVTGDTVLKIRTGLPPPSHASCLLLE